MLAQEVMDQMNSEERDSFEDLEESGSVEFEQLLLEETEILEDEEPSRAEDITIANKLDNKSDGEHPYDFAELDDVKSDSSGHSVRDDSFRSLINEHDRFDFFNVSGPSVVSRRSTNNFTDDFSIDISELGLPAPKVDIIHLKKRSTSLVAHIATNIINDMQLILANNRNLVYSCKYNVDQALVKIMDNIFAKKLKKILKCYHINNGYEIDWVHDKDEETICITLSWNTKIVV